MAKVSLKVGRGDFAEGVVEVLFEAKERSSFGGAQVLLQLGPTLLDGIEVGRVGRQVKQFRVCGLDSVSDAAHLVCGKIVHHHYVAGPERGTHHLVQIS